MIEENKINLIAKVDDDCLPAEIDEVPLEKETAKVINNIVKADSTEELKSYVDLFSLNIAKKNAVRIAKLQNLFDAVLDQASVRAEKHSGEFTNKEIIDYMKVIQEQIKAAKDDIENVGKEDPVIQINNQKNEVNITMADGLSRESKTKVVDIIKALVQQVTVPEPEEELYNNSDDSEEDEEEEITHE